jgi:glycosyltransferase involved in cell wall biosynthesis
MRVVNNGIDTSHYAPNEPEDKSSRWILYLGRITPQKGLDTLLAAYERVARHRPDVGLRIVGGETETSTPPEYREKLQEKAEKGAGTVEFIPHVEDVRPLLAASDLLALPSEWGEPFGRVLIEAMSSGVPVIASKDGGIPEVLAPEYEEHLVRAGDVRRWSKRILEFIDWRNEQPGLGPSMRSYVKQHFSADRTVRELRDILVDVSQRQSQKDFSQESRQN